MKSIIFFLSLLTTSLAAAYPGQQHYHPCPPPPPPPPKCSTSTTSSSSSTSSSPPPPTNSPFTIIAARSGSPIHLQEINANGNQFWIGKSTATFCPSSVNCTGLSNDTTALICYPNNGSPGTCTMDTEVPGGQMVYVNNSTGLLGYGIPHSAYLPPGAYTTGFSYTVGSPGEFSFEGGGSTGLVACPASSSCDETTGAGCFPYSIVAALSNVNIDNCLGFDARTETTSALVWEYT